MTRETSAGERPLVNTQQIGRCGELLVQYKLLRLGIESAPMTTDAGVDLVAYAASSHRAVTILVKCTDGPKPGGGKGKPALDWRISDNCPSELAAFVDLWTDTAWLLTKPELAQLAQQHAGGKYHFYMWVDATVKPRTGKLALRAEFDGYLLESRAKVLLAAR